MIESNAEKELREQISALSGIHKDGDTIEIEKNRLISRSVWKEDAGLYGAYDEIEPSERREASVRKLISTTREDAAFALLNTISLYKKISHIEKLIKRERNNRLIAVIAGALIGGVFGYII